MAKKTRRKKGEIIDGMSPDLERKYSAAIRKVWAWSKMRRLAIKRATNEEGFIVCENDECGLVTPKANVDHIIPCGNIMKPGYMKRLNCPSSGLQVLCPKCHRAKTKVERDAKKAK